jgi:tetratricopeptide (TPR) repeat protein
MKTNQTATCYILVKGSTQEESCTWKDLMDRIETGEIAPGTLLFHEESQRWMPIASLPEFSSHIWDEPEDPENQIDDSEYLSELKEEYTKVLRLARDRFDSIEQITRAGRLALSLGRREDAIAHYQRALELKPFNRGLATEIKRSFPPQVYRSFSCLERRPPFWSDAVSITTWPLDCRVLPFAVATAVLSLLSLIPFAEPIYWTLLTLLAVRITVHAEERSADPLPADMSGVEAMFADWKPLSSFMLAGAALLLPFAVLSEILLAAERAGHWNFLLYIQNSPLMTVALFIAGVVYLPAALMASTNERQTLQCLPALRRIMAVISSEEWEYLLLVISIACIALVWIGVRALCSVVPVVGDIIASAAALYAIMLIGYITGRTRSRHEHLL